MVGLVIVSHSARLAEGVVELAREMGGADVAIEPAGGIEEPEGALGTDATRVMAAIEAAGSGDGVVVLMDLGSAVMSAEMAAEMLGDAERVVLVGAPLVEGAVAAAAAARTGAGLDEVVAEARGALQAKTAHLGEDGAGAPPVAEAPGEDEGPEARLPVPNALGLHARPAARFVETAGRFDAQVSVRNATTGAGPASGRSLMGIAGLAVRQGHEIIVHASGPQAQEALGALAELAADGYGDGAGPAPSAPAPPAAEPEPEPAAPAEAPSAGTRLHGLAGSRGIAIGSAHPLGATAAGPVKEQPAGDPGAEAAALDAALAAARAALTTTRADVAQRAGEAEAEIFDAHLALLDDAAILDPARAGIARGRSAAAAWRDAARDAAAQMAALDDPLLRERAADVRDVGDRVLAELTGAGPAAGPQEPGIVVADELTPGQTAALDPELVRGIATARGSATAHAAILARALGIAAVVGAGPALLAVPSGTTLVVDGDAGDILVDPGDDVVSEHERRREEFAERRRRARDHAAQPAVTRDGEHLEVFANLGSAAEVAGAVEQGAEGVGLLRTEFLFLDREELPGIDEQAAVYAEIAEGLQGRPLVVRTLDVGADKPLRAVPHEPEANPYLGERGLRLALARPELLRTQLTAIARVAAEHPVRVMFPMVATVGEVRAARAVLDEVRAGAQLEVGIMVEVPAAALTAAILAAEVDFFSIGTNDLAQYTMAAERGNASVAPLLDGLSPALLRLIAMTCEGAAAHGARVAVCGELAGDPLAGALLVGVGVRELSMAPVLIPEAKEALRALDAGAARAAAQEAVGLDDAAAVRERAAALLGGA
jgi:multiphosphoryl transfer protein